MSGLDYRGVLERAGANIDAADGSQAWALGVLDANVHTLVEASRRAVRAFEAIGNDQSPACPTGLRLEAEQAMVSLQVALRRFRADPPAAVITDAMRAEAMEAVDGR